MIIQWEAVYQAPYSTKTCSCFAQWTALIGRFSPVKCSSVKNVDYSEKHILHFWLLFNMARCAMY